MTVPERMTVRMTVLARILSGVRFWVERCFTLDLRSLALFRIGLGALLVVDSITRALDAEIFYSEVGVAPRADFLASLTVRPSLYLLNGSTEFQLALLALTAACGLVLIAGWRTRVFTIVGWALMLSIQNRNANVNTGADAVMIGLMTWACLLPIGARYSLDARWRPERSPAGDTLVSWASAALVVQLVCIYFFNVVNKNTGAWWRGNAVMIALHIDEHATMLGVFIREHMTWLAKPLTWGTIAAESVPVLLFIPWRNDWLRVFCIATLWGLHIGFAACMWLGLFSPACMVGWIALLPATMWSRRPLARAAAFLGRIAPRAPTADQPRRVFRWLYAPLVIVITFGHVGSNIAVTTKTHFVPRPVQKLVGALHMHQPWKMFHSPGVNDGWWVIPGTLASGKEVDLFHDARPVTFDKPESVAHTYKTSRWRKYMMTASGERAVGMRRALAKYLCMSWNREHTGDDKLDDKLVKVEMIYMLEKTTNWAKAKPPKAMPMLEYECDRPGQTPTRSNLQRGPPT